MNLVREYLKEHGLAKLAATFNIKVSRHEEFSNLVLLKYDQLLSPMHEIICQECRGLILDEADEWRIVAAPFWKFFNYGESNAAAIDWNTARVYEKLDGSLMSLYWYAGEWRVSSSGKPDASGPMGTLAGTTMAECFWNTWRNLGYELPGSLWHGTTFMFEFMTPWNRVVVPHREARITLIGVRRDCLAEDFPEHYKHWGWQIVPTYEIGTAEGVLEAAQELRPLDSEGYVVCDGAFSRVKVKSPAYVALHHLRDSFSQRRLVELVRAGEKDEFLTYFPEFEADYKRVSYEWAELLNLTEYHWDKYGGIETQKEFALAVQHLPTKAALFAVRNKKAERFEHFYQQMNIDGLMALMGLREQAEQAVTQP